MTAAPDALAPFAPKSGCSCDVPEDGTYVHLTVENAVCPKVTGRQIKFAMTPMQLTELRRQIESALTNVW